MSSVIVSGVPILIAPTGVSRPRYDGVDRARAFDMTYRASQAGTAKRDFVLSTPPIPRALADLYETVLSPVSSQVCSGEILGESTNLLTAPEAFDDAAWTKTGTTVVANTGTAPNGTMTADNLREDNSTGSHAVTQAITNANGTYTISAWVRAVERNKMVIAMGDGATGNASIGVDLLTGASFASGLAVGSWTDVAYDIAAKGDGWYNVRVRGTRGAGTATTAQLWMWTTSLSYTGASPNSVNIWGAKLSTGNLNCCSEITGWSPTPTGSGRHRVVLSFVLHEV